MNKKVLIFTGSRADYGLLKNLIFKIKSEKKIICSGGRLKTSIMNRNIKACGGAININNL